MIDGAEIYLDKIKEVFSYRFRPIIPAVWTWFFIFNFILNFSKTFQIFSLIIFVTLILTINRSKNWVPVTYSEKCLLFTLPLLVLHTLLKSILSLPPHLSFLSATPIVWASAFLLTHLTLAYFPFQNIFCRKFENYRIEIVFVFGCTFILWFSFGAIERWLGLLGNYWDMGSIGQAMFNKSHGLGFVSTDPSGFSDSRFAQHFEVLFFILSPITHLKYWVEFMLTIQVLSVFLSGVFMGLAIENIIRHHFGFWIGLLGICLHASSEFPLLFDFHGDVFAMLPVSIMIWSITKKKWVVFWHAFLLAGAAIEYSLITTTGISLILIFGGFGTDIKFKKNGFCLLLCSVGLFSIILFVFMPHFRSTLAPSVLTLHSGAFRQLSWRCINFVPQNCFTLIQIFFNQFNLSSFIEIMIPLSCAFFLSPIALLGSLPNLAKDFTFGFELGTHHFAPAVPMLFLGLAISLREKIQWDQMKNYFVQILFCILLSSILWNPSPFSRLGWRTITSIPQLKTKVHDLISSADISKPRIISGNLGSILFNSHHLYFLGSTRNENQTFFYSKNSEVYLELWDQEFSGWSPIDLFQKQLFSLIEQEKGRNWLAISSGTLKLLSKENKFSNSNPGLLISNIDKKPSNSFETLIPLSRFQKKDECDSLHSCTIIAVMENHFVVPLGIKSSTNKWLFFETQSSSFCTQDRHLELRRTSRFETETKPIKKWEIIESISF